MAKDRCRESVPFPLFPVSLVLLGKRLRSVRVCDKITLINYRVEGIEVGGSIKMEMASVLGIAIVVAAMSSLSHANATSTVSPPSRDWRSDGRCGTRYVLNDGRAGQCDPNARGKGEGPCCSRFGHCGDTAAHCDCAGCTDFRRTEAMQWREDGRCGVFFPMPAGGPARCDPEATARNGRYGPCCRRVTSQSR